MYEYYLKGLIGGSLIALALGIMVWVNVKQIWMLIRKERVCWSCYKIGPDAEMTYLSHGDWSCATCTKNLVSRLELSLAGTDTISLDAVKKRIDEQVKEAKRHEIDK